jgi:FMN phosphatase YigB (HAD superfamily)
MNTIRTVIFDLGGVYFTEGVKQFVVKMNKHGISEERVRNIVDGSLGVEYRIGKITPAQFWLKAMNYWQLPLDTSTVTKMWLDGYIPIQGTSELIEKLKKADYELLFLSDNAPDRIEYLESQYHFLHKFKAGVFSHRAGVRKPDSKMYTEALKLTSSPPQACVYIDDKPKLLEPAQFLGMSTIAFSSPEQAESELRALGLDF